MSKIIISVNSHQVVEATLDESDMAASLMAQAEETVRAAQAKINEIDARLAAIDVEAVRPLRALAAGTASPPDTDKLAALEAEAVSLRTQRAALPPL